MLSGDKPRLLIIRPRHLQELSDSLDHSERLLLRVGAAGEPAEKPRSARILLIFFPLTGSSPPMLSLRKAGGVGYSLRRVKRWPAGVPARNERRLAFSAFKSAFK